MNKDEIKANRSILFSTTRDDITNMMHKSLLDIEMDALYMKCTNCGKGHYGINSVNFSAVYKHGFYKYIVDLELLCPKCKFMKNDFIKLV